MDDNLTQLAHRHIEQFGRAAITDKELDSRIREHMVQNASEVMVRVQQTNEEGGEYYALIGLSAAEVQAARGFGMSLVDYAKNKLS